MAETHLVVNRDICYSITEAEGIGPGVFMCNNKNIHPDCGNLDTGYVSYKPLNYVRVESIEFE